MLQDLLHHSQDILSSGFKITGNYQQSSDTIRAWSKNDNSQFLIILNGNYNFGNNFSSLEIQSFPDKASAHKLAISFLPNEQVQIRFVAMNRNYLETHEIEIDSNEFYTFSQEFLGSRYDLGLTIQDFNSSKRSEGTYELLGKLGK